MDTFDGDIGVWKSAPGKGRKTPKGRQIDDAALSDVRALLGDSPRRRDLLIEFLHLIQDRYGHLSVAHLNALADEMHGGFPTADVIASVESWVHNNSADGRPMTESKSNTRWEHLAGLLKD